MAEPLQFTDLSANTSIQLWIRQRERRGKDQQDSLRKIMKTWLFAAYEMVEKSHPANKAKIQRDLMQIVTVYEKAKWLRGKVREGIRGKAADQMRDTLAAKLIWALDWKGARSAMPKGGWQTAAFYKLAKQFVRARLFSSGIHRAGFFAGFDLVHGRPSGSSGPRYRKAPIGDAKESLIAHGAEILVENWASSKNGEGIAGIAGSAFEATLPGVLKIFEEYGLKDELAIARQAGFSLMQ